MLTFITFLPVGVGYTPALFIYLGDYTMPGSKEKYRPDRNGPYRSQFETNKRIILATQTICGICGKPVDKSLKAPHPLSATVDHIIPVAKHGHPSDLSNLQLAHRACNRAKSDHLPASGEPQPTASETGLPQSHDWRKF